MNISISKEEDSPTKQEAENTRDGNVARSSWLRQKDPRIVRVSRAFGGKDRHSKVCTIRGLRDRRVRLSVPTAIQLYDLQDRLGLNQPSKVIDWLLDAAKQEIDELPPLPFAPMNFALNHHEIIANKEGFKISNWGYQDFDNNDSVLRAKSKQLERDTSTKTESNEGQLGQYEKNHCSPSYGSYYQLDNSNFASSHLAGFTSQCSDRDLHNLNNLPLPPYNLSLSSSSQVFLPQPYFPAQNITSSADRQINQFQMFSSSTQNLFPSSITASNPYSTNDHSSGSSRGFHFNVSTRLFNSNNGGSQAADKDHQDFPCK